MLSFLSFIEKITSKPYLFRRIFTFSLEEWQLLANKLEPEWQELETDRLLKRKDRLNKIGQGRPYEVGSFANLLLVALLYWRTNIGYELLGFIFDIDQTTVKRIVRRLSPLLLDRFIPKTALTKNKQRSNKLDDLLATFPELVDVIFDGTELPTERPKKRQKQQYSGKKKRHTKKVQIAIDKKSKLITAVSPPAKGKIHDKKQLERTGWDHKLSKKVKRFGDLGYQGMPTDTWNIPHKKPHKQELTKKQKKENRKLSRQRIKVEHAIRGIKIFRRIGETIKTKSNELLLTSILVAANLYNFKVLVRQGLG
ncbi:MAG: transposase family protein [Candidatus Parcubacteria bacterium]|nr:transposase family protein [Candidatus Parcubacteria bacterium]